MNIKYMHLGDFQVKSGELILSDPCYEEGIWCSGTLSGIRNGTWNAYVSYYEDSQRVDELVVVYDDLRVPIMTDSWTEKDFVLGVDSGQMVIMDKAAYRKSEALSDPSFTTHLEHVNQPDESAAFYQTMCDLSLSKTNAGVFPRGVVSSTGWGDGSYACEVAISDEEIDAVRIVFIDEDDY